MFIKSPVRILWMSYWSIPIVTKNLFIFLGAKQSTLDRLIPLISKDYPTLRIAGFHDGYFSDEQQVQIAEEIAKVSPDFLIIALPTPKKERFIKKYKNSMQVSYLV